MREINADALRRLRESGAPHVLLDVRERGEFSLGQIPDATPLPRGLIELRLPLVVPDPGLPLVLYCDDGRRSTLAAATCEQMGYGDVAVLADGLNGWQLAGGAVIEGWGVGGKAYGERVAVSGAVEQITAEELAARRARGEPLTVVDVRTAEEYLRGHVPDAYHVPGGQLPREVPALVADPDAPVVVSCAGRTRGILGARLLREAGLRNVWALLNGAMGWKLAGYELEEGPGRGRPAVSDDVRAPWMEEATRRLVEAEGIRFITAGDYYTLRLMGTPHYSVDVRLPEEYRAGHVTGAISLPAGQLALHYENWLAVRTLPLVLMAYDAMRPVWAAALCQRLGFTDVRVLEEDGMLLYCMRARVMETGDGMSVAFGLAEARDQVPAIAPRELAQALERRTLTLLDVRGSGEFGTGHIPGARWLARGKLELQIERMVPDRATPIVTVCDTEVRSTLAAAALRGLGYGDARVLAEGVPGWQRAGLPVEEGLDGADVSVAEAQGDFGHTLWSGALQRTRADMERYLTWEENLAKPG